MSESTPADLAVAFRSFERRLGEALAPVGGDRRHTPQIASLTEQIDAELARVAGELRTAASWTGVAAAIQRRHADDWTPATLAPLRDGALSIGRMLRELRDAAERAAG
jgi:hypothetical protein